jgi:hypothetical protein
VIEGLRGEESIASLCRREGTEAEPLSSVDSGGDISDEGDMPWKKRS